MLEQKTLSPICMPFEKITHVKYLPNKEDIKQGVFYSNLGYLYEEYSAVFISA